MRRSFRIHVFLAVALCVVAFSGASRLMVANSAFEPLHGHFSEVLARHAARELRAHLILRRSKATWKNLWTIYGLVKCWSGQIKILQAQTLHKLWP